MFEFAETVDIGAPLEEVWDYLADVDQWWLASNPEHIKIAMGGSGSDIVPGTKVSFEERIAGVRGRAEGTITKVVPENVIEWQGDAVYRYFGLSFRVREGVSWQVGDGDPGAKLSAHVWAEFSASFAGRLFEWYAKTLLNVVDRDREHARRELEYLRSAIESMHQPSNAGY